MDTAAPPHQRLFDELLAFGDLKVWSVLVTIFGDLAPDEGASLPGPVLSTLTGRLGIRTEAQRVALHRLRKDGWITVQRDGRVSLYGFSDLARAETAAVHGRVFDAHVDRPQRCFLVIGEPGRQVAGIALGGGAFLSVSPPDRRIGLLVSEMAVADLPGWARDKAIPPGVQEGYERLHALLEAGVSGDPVPKSDRLALRILALHRWRRLVLSHSREAAHLMGADWTGNTCRARVHEVLTALPRSLLQDGF